MSCVAFLTFATAQAQVIKSFSERSPEGSNTKVHKLKGNFEIIGNSNIEAASGTNNGNVHMKYIDVDNDPTTVNSSSATLVYSDENNADHANTTVAFAGLYWTGRAHDGNNSPLTAILPGTTEEKFNTNSFYGYELSITSSDDNSKGFFNQGRVSTYTFTPQVSGDDVVVFKYYTWRTGISIFSTYHHKVTVQVGNASAEDVQLNNSASSSASANMSYLMGSGNNAFLITQLHKHRTSNNINNSFKVTIIADYKNLNKQVVKFKKAGQAYETITAAPDEIYYPTSDHGFMYSAYADVTSYVQQHGAGEYTLADLMVLEGNGGPTGFYGGWSLVVIYSNPAMNSRNITVFDGHAYVPGSITRSHEINISGFETVPSGDVNVKIGYMAGEGDRDISGDYLQVQNQTTNAWQSLVHSNNSANNFFNSTITTNGPRNPMNTNNFGIDIGVVEVNNPNAEVIPNGATSAQFRYGTTQDTYIIPLFVFGVEAFSTKGMVVNDANALKDGQVNSSGNHELPMVYAHVLDADGSVVRVEAMDVSTGELELAGLGNGTYTVQLSAVENSVGTTEALFDLALPKGWVFSGESTTGGTPDNEADGRLEFVMQGGDVTGLIFGMNKLPIVNNDPNNITAMDYAGSDFYEVPPTAFVSDDFDGYVSQLLLTAFPEGVSEMKIDNIVYTATNFPLEGVLLSTDKQGYPIESIALYLTQSLVDETIEIPFHVFDNGGYRSEIEGSAYLLISSILPVEMVSFEAYKKGKVNLLEWKTQVEINNKGFHVERSEDAKKFENIGFVAATGDKLVNQYEFVDEQPHLITYYRLKQEDIDGRIAYSEVRRVDQSAVGNNVTVYPNPTRDMIHIKQDRMVEKEAVLVNVAGQIVQVVALDAAVTSLKLSHLPRGVYYLNVGEETIRILLN